MAKNFRHRTHATQRYAGTTAGFYNDFVHLSGGPGIFQVTPSGGFVLVTLIINTAPGSGVVILTCGSDIIAEISSSASATFEHKYNCYLYDVLNISLPDGTVDLTAVITRGFGGSNASMATVD